MSAETKIKYPFPICEDCVAAKIVVNQQRQKGLLDNTGERKAIQLTCWVHAREDGEKISYIGGTTIESYPNHHRGPWEGHARIVANPIEKSTNHAPDFCPQLQNEES